MKRPIGSSNRGFARGVEAGGRKLEGRGWRVEVGSRALATVRGVDERTESASGSARSNAAQWWRLRTVSAAEARVGEVLSAAAMPLVAKAARECSGRRRAR